MSASFAATFFVDYAAAKKEQRQMTVENLLPLIRDATAPAKAELPWIKLARFGNAASDKGSLRHDRNVIAISGVEGDYDGELVSFDDAVEIAEKAGLRAIIYTSPSHAPERPRWRILCPTSRELPPVEHAHMVGRVNGLYRGILSAESFALSQAYFYGSVNGNPHHQVQAVDGQPIDALDELDLIAIGKPATKTAGNGAGGGWSGPADEKALIDQIVTGESYHTAAIRLLGLWAHRSVAMLEAEQRLHDLFEGVFPPDRDARWQARVGEIPRLLEHVWSKEAGKTSPPNGEAAGEDAGVSLGDFYAYMPMHSYIFAPSRDVWPASSVNARILPIPVGIGENGEPKTLKANLWLDQNRPVEQMTWAPGRPMIIENMLISEGGWIERKGVACFNLYRPPNIKLGDPAQAQPWLDHVYKVYPNDAAHIVRWLAHRRQHPEDKINHALVLGGPQGIGKDTLLEPVKRAVGAWNWAEPSPTQMMGRFNGFAKSVILRISEARDLGDVDRYKFYEHLKIYAAAPPDVLRVDEKNLREHSVQNCCGVIITTNHKTDGICLPADDRRHYVAWSSLTKDDFDEAYWDKLWGWYANGGDRHVAAYLATTDLSTFNPKAPPPKTEAFWTIVNTGRSPEDAEMSDCLEYLGNPEAITITEILNAAEKLFPPSTLFASSPRSDSFSDWLRDRRNRRVIPHRFEACGYAPVRNPDRGTGLWVIAGKRAVVYAQTTLTMHDQIAAARRLR